MFSEEQAYYITPKLSHQPLWLTVSTEATLLRIHNGKVLIEDDSVQTQN